MAGLPAALTAALYDITAEMDSTRLEKDAKNISEAYRMRTGTGKRLLTRESEAAAYAAARMPATYEAARAAILSALDASGLAPRTLLDCGAGTGAATWAADDLLTLERVTCLEREDAMRSVGSALMRAAIGTLERADWQAFDLTDGKPLPQAEMVVESYMLGELAEEMRLPVARKLWDACTQMLVLIEPGTPQGFANLAAVRKRKLPDDGGGLVPFCRACAAHKAA